MPKEVAILEYTIIFDPSETWAHLSDMERDLAEFLKLKGLQAQIVSPLNSPTKRVLYLSKLVEVVPEVQNVPVDQVQQSPVNKPVQSIKQRFNQFAQRRDFGGKFRKLNK